MRVLIILITSAVVGYLASVLFYALLGFIANDSVRVSVDIILSAASILGSLYILLILFKSSSR